MNKQKDKTKKKRIEGRYAPADFVRGELKMKKNYRHYQRYNQSKFPKHVGPNRRDSNGNIIYYESLSSTGYIIQHYQEYDSLNRRTSYRDSQGTHSTFTYYGNTNTLKQEYEIFPDQGNKSLRITNYNRYGCIKDKSIVSGNTRFYQKYESPYTKTTTYSPYERIFK